MPSCGTFSMYDVGSFILFPRFSLCVNDSDDNLVSYRSIGREPCSRLDYAEPRAYPPSARPSKITQDDPSPSDDESTSTATTAAESDSDSDTISQSSPPSSTPPPAAVSQDVIPEDELLANTTKPLSQTLLSRLHDDPHDLPEVGSASTPAACENRTTFDSLKLHKIFGCRRFKNQQHLTSASDNARLIHTGELPPTIGDFATIVNPPKGKPLRKRRKFLDKFHMDIVFGDCVALGNFRYALLLVDVSTRYAWLYGLESLTSNEVIAALEAFQADAGRLPKKFHADFDKKLIGGGTLRWINKNKSKIIAANAGRQSSNGLVERTWRTIITMARAYITEKQVGREFWYYAILHAVLMINQVPGRLGRKLTSPFELVHGVKPDSRTWFELFSFATSRATSAAEFS